MCILLGNRYIKVTEKINLKKTFLVNQKIDKNISVILIISYIYVDFIFRGCILTLLSSSYALSFSSSFILSVRFQAVFMAYKIGRCIVLTIRIYYEFCMYLYNSSQLTVYKRNFRQAQHVWQVHNIAIYNEYKKCVTCVSTDNRMNIERQLNKQVTENYLVLFKLLPIIQKSKTG